MDSAGSGIEGKAPGRGGATTQRQPLELRDELACTAIGKLQQFKL